MKKIVVLLLAALLLLTGCHGTLAENAGSSQLDYPVPESFDTAKQHTITF